MTKEEKHLKKKERRLETDKVHELLNMLEQTTAFNDESPNRVAQIKLVTEVVLTKPQQKDTYTHTYIAKFISKYNSNIYGVKSLSATTIYEILRKYPYFVSNKTEKGNNWSIDIESLTQFLEKAKSSNQLRNIANHVRNRVTGGPISVDDVPEKTKNKWIGPTRFREQLIMNATPAERKVYDYLVKEKIKFKFQEILYKDNKVYCIPDFIIGEKLIVELDGSSHKEKDENDLRKMYELGQCGYIVIHVPNSIILNDFVHFESLISGYIMPWDLE